MALRYTSSGNPYATSDITVAGRFRPEGPLGWFDRRSLPIVLRATREEAEADVAARADRRAGVVDARPVDG